MPSISLFSLAKGVSRTGVKNIFGFQQGSVLMASSKSTDSLVVEHDAKNGKFFIKLDNVEAKLEYAKQKSNGDEVLNMWHTEVPPQLQGQGIAKVLAKAAFDFVVDNKHKMQLSCSYLQKYLADNPSDKYKSVIVKY